MVSRTVCHKWIVQSNHESTIYMDAVIWVCTSAAWKENALIQNMKTKFASHLIRFQSIQNACMHACMHTCIPKGSSWVKNSTTKFYSNSLPPPLKCVQFQIKIEWHWVSQFGMVTLQSIPLKTCFIMHNKCIEMVITWKCLHCHKPPMIWMQNMQLNRLIHDISWNVEHWRRWLPLQSFFFQIVSECLVDVIWIYAMLTVVSAFTFLLVKGVRECIYFEFI